MQRTLIFALMAGVLFLAPLAQADEGLCPMMTLQHSQELGLSKRQKTEIEKIREDMMEQMRSMKRKASDDVSAVLTEKQRKKAGEMDMDCPMMMKGGECPGMKGHRGPHGGACPMKDEHRHRYDE